MKRGKIHATAALMVLAFLALDRPASAYIDPGTGSMLLQLLLATVFGALMGVKIFWQRITLLWSNLFSSRDKSEQSDD